MVALGSIIGPYLGITFSFLAIIYVQIGIASTIMATTPIIMLPLSWMFYKEKLTYRAVIGAIVAVLGVGLLFLL
jgi:drug/metabolite transporter (DMT)-like permease